MSTTFTDRLHAANARHAARIALLEKRIDALREEAASASLSAGGGSKSYTNVQIAALVSEIERHQSAIARNNAAIGGRTARRVYTVRA